MKNESNADHGGKTEDLIESICTKTFLSDFTVRSPKYTKTKGREKEIADILIPFNNTLIAFQVKTKYEAKTIHDRDEVELDRIERKVGETVRQFKAIEEAFRNDKIDNLVSVRGYQIPYKNNNISQIIGIAVLDILGEDDLSDDDKTGIFCPVHYVGTIPIHVFMRDEFEIITNVLDTLPDFLAFINKREEVKSKLPIITSELDLLALYMTNPRMIDDIITEKVDKVFLTDLWDSYKDEYNALMEFKIQYSPDYIIDHILEQLHTTIGFNSGIELPKGPNVEEGNEIDNYLEIATILNGLNRAERVSFGHVFFGNLEIADKDGFSFSFSYYKEKSEGIFFYSTKDDRQKRMDKLYKLSSAVYCVYDLTKIIGIATDNLAVKMRSYDFLLMDGVSFTNRDELIAWGSQVFKKPE